MKKSIFYLLSLHLFITLILISTASADTLETNEHRITSSTDYDSTPTLGYNDVEGTDYVVYTKRPLLAGGNLGPGDIYYQPIVNGVPTGILVQVTSGPTDDQLNDCSGDYIVYTAYDSVTSISGSIIVYQISTRILRTLGTATIIQEPKIHGEHVVWRAGGAFAAIVMYYNLRTQDDPVPLSGPIPPTFDIQIGSRYAVWAEYDGGTYDVYAYDFDTAMEVRVTNTEGINERQPATSGNWIVWQQQDGSTSTIEAKNMVSLEQKTLSYGPGNFNPSIDGDLVAWESDSEVILWDEPVMLDFNVDANGDSVEAGTIASNQWNTMGVDVSCINNDTTHSDHCVVLDSYNPPMGQNDLSTHCQGNILVVAQDDVDTDGNGLVDFPYAEESGGQIRLTFDSPVDISEIRVVDIDPDEGGSAAMVVIDAGGGTIVVPIPVLSDGSVQDIAVDVPYAKELTVSFIGTGALASVSYTPAQIPQVVGVSDPNLNIWVHRLSTNRSYTVTTDTADQYLNDVFGDMVAYVDMSSGSEDVYVSSLRLDPTADAGVGYQDVNVEELVLLDGSESRDNLLSPFDDIEEISYEWCLEKPFASGAVLQGADTPSPSFTPDVGGLYMAILTVTRQSDGAISYPDTVKIYARCDVLRGDTDFDSICNDNDNCPDIANWDQADADGDGIGDACEQLNQPPVAVCKDITKSLEPDCTGTASPEEIDGGSYDPDGDSITLSWTCGNCIWEIGGGPGVISETLMVTDDNELTDTCVATITFIDEDPPIIECPQNVFIERGESTDPSAVGHATASDNCSPGLLEITYTDNGAGTCPTVTTRTWMVTDGSGNQDSCEQTITLMDTTPPVINLPSDITVYAVDSSGAIVNFTATANDAADGVITPVCEPPSGSTFPIGSTIVECTASDACGNYTTGNFSVTILGDSDGDGLPDDQDVCPDEDSTGYDVDNNGCIDSTAGLIDLLNKLIIEGVIEPELRNSLTTKVENAEKKADKDNICAAINGLESLKNQVNAQTGKKISNEAAARIIAYTDSLISWYLSQLPPGDSC